MKSFLTPLLVILVGFLNAEAQRSTSNIISDSLQFKGQQEYPLINDENNLRVNNDLELRWIKRTREDYNVDNQQFEPNKRETKDYSVDGELKHYFLVAAEGGDYTDTTNWRHTVYRSEDTSYPYQEVSNYSYRLGKMRLENQMKGLTYMDVENECGGTEQEFYYEYEYRESYADLANGEPVNPYIYRTAETTFDQDILTTHTYGISYEGDTTSYAQSKGHVVYGSTYQETVYYDDQGAVESGTKKSTVYDDQGRVLSYDEETYNAGTTSYDKIKYEKYEYDDMGNLTYKETGGSVPAFKYEYTYENNLETMEVQSNWSQALGDWEKKHRLVSNHDKVDTVLIDTYNWFEDDWSLVQHDWEIMKMDGDDQLLIGGSGYFSDDFFTQLDTVTYYGGNSNHSSRKFYYGSADGYQLINDEKLQKGSHCLVLESYNAYAGGGKKQVQKFEHPLSGDLRTANYNYTSTDADISDGVDWKIKDYFERKYEQFGEVAPIAEYVGYSQNSKVKYLYERNAEGQTVKYTRYESDDENPEDGVDWWISQTYDYSYEGGFISELIIKERESKEAALSLTYKEIYENGTFGTSNYAYGTWDGSTFVPLDSSYYEYDALGNVTMYTEYQIDESGNRTGGRRITTEYESFPLAADSFINEARKIIYPNPSSGLLTIDLQSTEKAKVKIYSLQGSLLMERSILGQQQIGVQKLKDGIYVIDIQTDNGHWSQKIKIQQ